MKPIEEMLRHLGRPEVSEFAIATGRLPCVKVSGAYQPVDDSAPSSEVILEMLVGAGGSRYVDALGEKPVQWTTRVEGVGTVTVGAVLRGDKVQARFIVSKKDPAAPVVRDAPRRSYSIDLEPTLQSPAAAADGSTGQLGNIREIDFGEDEERPTRPVLNAIELGEANAAAGPEVGTARDLEFGDDGKAHVAAATARGIDPAFLDEVLGAARTLKASDVHVIADRPVLFRIAGDLAPRGQPIDARAVEAALLPRIPSRCRKTLEEDGSCDFALQHPAHGRFRVNVTRQRTGYKGCFRLIADAIPTLESLGLPPEIAKATHHHQGLIVITGPTGHGKTTTLAAIVDIINSGTTHHIITVEDPVEYVHPRKQAMMSQREVGTHTLSFQNALKASLREDPDVIVVGELRDTETVRMALSASETGHLVLGTMNTPSAAKTIDRLIDLFPPSDQAQVRMTLAGGLRLIVSQRLIPNPDRTGLVVAAELLPGSVPLWSLIRDGKTFQIPSLQQRGKGAGILRIDDSLADLVRSGRTTREIAMTIAESPDELDAVLAGKRDPYVAPEPPKPTGGILGKAGSLFGGKKG
jgi:twitching motility protein PilT